MSDNKNVVIVVKKVKKGGGHHGGSWKVAYADFVTAMMAFFLVMWIVSMDQGAKDLVEGYFNDPIGFRRAFGAGRDPLSQGSTPIPTDIQRMPIYIRQVEQRRFNAVRDQILRELEGTAGMSELSAQVEVVLTPDGLRIELREGEGAETFFTVGSAGVKPATVDALRIVVANIQELPNPVVVEGHTDSAGYPSDSYTNWELSVDRANAARRVLAEQGLSPERILEVRGHADRSLLLPDAPFDPANRRVSILIPYLVAEDTGDEDVPGIPEAGVGAAGG